MVPFGSTPFRHESGTPFSLRHARKLPVEMLNTRSCILRERYDIPKDFQVQIKQVELANDMEPSVKSVEEEAGLRGSIYKNLTGGTKRKERANHSVN